MDRSLRVLFVCGGNSCRSQMAEGMLRALAGDRAVAASAGLHAEGVNPLAIEVMHELEIDISGQRSTALAELGNARFDLVITLCEPARDLCVTCIDDTCSVVGADADVNETPMHGGLPHQLHWLVPDPAKATGDPKQVKAVFRAARDRIRTHIEALVGHGYLSTLTQDRHVQDELLGLLEEGVMILDEKQRIYLFNTAATRITGFQRDEVMGRHCSAVLGAHGVEGLQQGIERRSPGETLAFELPIILKHGGEQRVRLSLSGVDPAHEQPGRIIVVFHAIVD